MNKDTSIYLDAIRFMAAVAVFLSHVCGARFTYGTFWQMEPYGSEAVDIFFVLSGFVIAYIYETRERTAAEYAVSRLARIYSVALPALVVTFVLDALGRHTSPGIYAARWGYEWNDRLLQAVACLFFVQRFWTLTIAPGSDVPYWSLGFEVWYYIIFAVAVFAPKKWRAPVIIALLILVGPKIAILFPLWLMGVAAYKISTQCKIRRAFATLLCIAPLILWGAYEFASWRFHDRAIITNFTGRKALYQDWIVGTLFFAHLTGFCFVSDIPGRILRVFERPIRWCAGATLTMYLFHLPLSQFLAAELPWAPYSWQKRACILVGVPILVFLIAQVTERRKSGWRRFFRALILRARLRLVFSTHL